MTTERWLRLIAGVFVIGGTILAALVDQRWLLLTGFVGVNLLQSGLTDWCPMKTLLERSGARSQSRQ